MAVVASPSTVKFEPGDVSRTTDIFATIVSDTSVPQSGIAVLFTTSSGQLLSAGSGRTTDGSGVARDTLTLESDDPSSITVTATSGALTKTVTVTKTVAGFCDANTAPTARIEPSATQSFPTGALNSTRNADPLSGSTSSDAENGIASYAWDCGNGTDPIVGPNATCTYTYLAVSRSYLITLVVTDEGLPDHPECALQSAPVTVQINVPASTLAQ